MVRRLAPLSVLFAGLVLFAGCVPDCINAISDFFRVGAGSTDVSLDVGANDNLDGANVQFSIVSGPQNGTLTLVDAATGVFSYTPGENMPRNGHTVDRDTFTYQISGVCTDRNGNSKNTTSVARVVILIQGTAPASQCNARNDSASTSEDTPVTIDVLANDDPCATTIESITQPANGTVTPQPPTSGSLTYTPLSGFTGTDTFTYTINGGSQATVTVDVQAAAALPQDDFASTPDEDTPVDIPVLANDPPGSTLVGIVDPVSQNTVQQATLSSGAIVTVSGDNITYDPNGTSVTTDTFVYLTNTGQATVTVGIGAPLVMALGQVVFDNQSAQPQNWTVTGASLIDPTTMLPAQPQIFVAPQTAETYLVQLGPPGIGSASIDVAVRYPSSSGFSNFNGTCTVFEIEGQPSDLETRISVISSLIACQPGPLP